MSVEEATPENMIMGTPQEGFIAIMMKTAKHHTLNCIDPMRQVLLRLDADMFSGRDLVMFHAIYELVQLGVPPGPGELMNHFPGEIGKDAVEYYFAREETYTTLASAADAVFRKHEAARMNERLVEAQAALRRGELGLARTLMADAASEAPSDGSQDEMSLETFVWNPQKDKRAPIGMTRVDDMLGGGIGFTGRSVMSLWVASTSIGKSTFMQCVPLPAWLSQGHWVYYFTGESDADEVIAEVARMRAKVTFTMARYARDSSPTPDLVVRMQAGMDALLAMPGRLMVFQGEFNDHKIRMLAAARKSELEQKKRDGEVHPGTELIVVVDNLDHAIEGLETRHREDQIYNQAARRFVLAARQHSYHIALLHQANAEGDRRNGPPLKGDVAFSKAIVNHAAFMVTLYRPTTSEDFAAVEADGSPGRRACHWIAVRKARGGSPGEIKVESNATTGQWFDEDHTEAPF